MNRLLLGIVGLVCGVTLFSGIVKADLFLDPYVGAEVGMKHLNFKANTVSGLKNSGPRVHVLGGIRFNSFVGLEVGANLYKRSANAKINLRTLNVGLVGFYPICDCVKVVGLAGIAHSKVKLSSRIDLDQTTTVKKVIPFATLGLQQNFAEGFDVRVSTTFHNTKKLVNALNRPRNSFSYNVGLIYSF